MTTSSTGSGHARGPAPSRTIAQIAAAGIALADDAGLPAVTMRAVAAALGLAPAALYRYVTSRDELLEHMVEAALATIALPPPVGEPDAALVALVQAQVVVLRAHPWLIDTLTSVRPGATAVRMLDEGLRILGPAPASGAAKLELLALLTGVATLFARSGGAPAPGTVEVLQAAAATHPHLAAAFADPGTRAPQQDLLARTVRAMLRGLDAPPA